MPTIAENVQSTNTTIGNATTYADMKDNDLTLNMITGTLCQVCDLHVSGSTLYGRCYGLFDVSQFRGIHCLRDEAGNGDYAVRIRIRIRIRIRVAKIREVFCEVTGAAPLGAAVIFCRLVSPDAQLFP